MDKLSFEVVSFGENPTEFGPTSKHGSDYEFAVNFIIRFDPSKIVLLGTNGDWSMFDCDFTKSHTVFGVYYALKETYTGLEFVPNDN